VKNNTVQLLNPFGGQKMTCLLCGVEEKSSADPDVVTDWRAVHIEGDIFYACPDEFPPDTADQTAFQEAYQKFVLAAIEKRTQLVAERRQRLMSAIRGPVLSVVEGPNGKLKKIQRKSPERSRRSVH